MLAVQKDKAVAQKFANRVRKLDLSHLSISVSPLHQVALEVPVELAYLDFFGNPTPRDYRWIIAELIPHLTTSFRLGITTDLESRGNGLSNVLKTELAALPEFAYLAKHYEVSQVVNGAIASDYSQVSREWAVMYSLLLSLMFPSPVQTSFYSYTDGARMMYVETTGTQPQGIQSRLYDSKDTITSNFGTKPWKLSRSSRLKRKYSRPLVLRNTLCRFIVNLRVQFKSNKGTIFVYTSNGRRSRPHASVQDQLSWIRVRSSIRYSNNATGFCVGGSLFLSRSNRNTVFG